MELSEEEKKAIEYIKEFKNEVLEGVGNKSTMAKNIDILLNLIDRLQKEIEEKRTIIFAGAEKVKELEKGNQSLMDSRKKWKNRYYKQRKEIEELKQNRDEYKEEYKKLLNARYYNYISKDKIRERKKHNEKQKNVVVSVARFKIDNDGITGEGIEGLNDLIVYKNYEAVINELNYLLEEN